MKKNKIILLSILLILSALVLSSCSGSSTMNNSTSWPGISSDGKTVYSAYNTSISAVNDGTKVWNYPESAENGLSFYAAPLVDGDKVYAGTYNNQVHVLNKETGTLIQKIELPSVKSKIIASPVIADGLLLISSSDGTVYAYALSDLTKSVWSVKLTSEIWTTPLVVDGEVYVASLDKKLIILDLESGEVLKSIETDGAVMDDLVSSNEMIYFSTLGKEVDSFDPQNAEIKTVIQADGEIWASPLVFDDTIIAADMAGNVYCNSLQTGKSLWTLTNITGDGTGIIAAPVETADGNILIAAENGDLFVYDSDGKSVNTRSTKAKALTSPIVFDDSIVVAFVTGDSLLKSYTSDLKEDWLYFDEPVTAASEPVATSEPAE